MHVKWDIKLELQTGTIQIAAKNWTWTNIVFLVLIDILYGNCNDLFLNLGNTHFIFVMTSSSVAVSNWQVTRWKEEPKTINSKITLKNNFLMLSSRTANEDLMCIRLITPVYTRVIGSWSTCLNGCVCLPKFDIRTQCNKEFDDSMREPAWRNRCWPCALEYTEDGQSDDILETVDAVKCPIWTFWHFAFAICIKIIKSYE